MEGKVSNSKNLWLWNISYRNDPGQVFPWLEQIFFSRIQRSFLQSPCCIRRALRGRRRNQATVLQNFCMSDVMRCSRTGSQVVDKWRPIRQETSMFVFGSVAQPTERVSAASAVPPNNPSFENVIMFPNLFATEQILSTAWATFTVFTRSAAL